MNNTTNEQLSTIRHQKEFISSLVKFLNIKQQQKLIKRSNSLRLKNLQMENQNSALKIFLEPQEQSNEFLKQKKQELENLKQELSQMQGVVIEHQNKYNPQLFNKNSFSYLSGQPIKSDLNLASEVINSSQRKANKFQNIQRNQLTQQRHSRKQSAQTPSIEQYLSLDTLSSPKFEKSPSQNQILPLNNIQMNSQKNLIPKPIQNTNQINQTRSKSRQSGQSNVSNQIQHLIDKLGNSLVMQYLKVFQKYSSRQEKMTLREFAKFFQENQLESFQKKSIQLEFYKISGGKNFIEFEGFMRCLNQFTMQKYPDEKSLTVRFQQFYSDFLQAQKLNSPRSEKLQNLYIWMQTPENLNIVLSQRSDLIKLFKKATKETDLPKVVEINQLIQFYKTYQVIPIFCSLNEVQKIHSSLQNQFFDFNNPEILFLEISTHYIAQEYYTKNFQQSAFEIKAEMYVSLIGKMKNSKI